MGIDHIVVAFVDRKIDRFANRSARMMQAVCHIGQLHKIAEVLDRGIAPSAFAAVNERAAIGRDQHQVVAADHHVVIRVAGILGEHCGRALLDDFPAHAARKAHPHPIGRSPGSNEQCDRFGIVLDVDPDLFKDRVGVVFQRGQIGIAQHRIGRNEALDIGFARGLFGSIGGCTATPASGTHISGHRTSFLNVSGSAARFGGHGHWRHRFLDWAQWGISWRRQNSPEIWVRSRSQL